MKQTIRRPNPLKRGRFRRLFQTFLVTGQQILRSTIVSGLIQRGKFVGANTGNQIYEHTDFNI